MKNGIVKISFIGDIMCELPLLKASKNKNGYNFDKVFENVKNIFEESDYVVGNLETICAGKEFGYTKDLFSFNSPVEFVESIKKAGIDMVTTATNHSLDRGVEGLLKNLDILDKYELKSIGTYRNKQERERIFIENFDGLKIAFLNYTYGTNAHINGVELKHDELHHINLLKPQNKELNKYRYSMKSMKLKPFLARNLFKFISLKNWIKLKRMLGLKYYTSYQDNDLDDIDNEYLDKLKSDLQKAKKEADFVIMCMHSGGQFHAEPGDFSKYMMRFMLENGADIVVGNHPHVVQRIERFSRNKFGAYSLGNFSISPSSVYVLPDNLPEYSIMLHAYLSKKEKKINKMTFSILKIVEFEDGSLTVYPVDELIKELKSEQGRNKLRKDVTTIYNKFTGLNERIITIKREYALTKGVNIGKS